MRFQASAGLLPHGLGCFIGTVRSQSAYVSTIKGLAECAELLWSLA